MRPSRETAVSRGTDHAGWAKRIATLASEKGARISYPHSEPEPEQVDPEIQQRAADMLKRACDLARHLGLDRQVMAGDVKGFRVPVELEDELDRRALELLKESDEPALLEVIEDRKGTYLVVKPRAPGARSGGAAGYSPIKLVDEQSG
jgi:hypothetical protein